MLRSGRIQLNKTRLISGLIIAILFCIAWISYGISESAKYERQADDKTSEYTRYTGEKVAQACVGISSLEKIKCLNEAFEAKREYERNQTDLVAQRQSALWAYVMAAAAVIGMALSAVGVWLVKTTFDETRKSNDIAQDHQRARLLASAQLMPAHHLSETMKVVLSCENIGLSPAYRVRCFTLSVKNIPEMPPADAIEGFERTMTVGSTYDLVEVENFENDHHVVGMIQYDTIFGGPKYSYFCFCFVWSLRSRKWFAVSQIPKTWPRDT
jgi:hypothetical protein